MKYAPDILGRMSTNNNNSGAAGGGGSGGFQYTGITVSPGQVYTYTLGQGGWTVICPEPIVEPAPVESKKQYKDGCFCKKCKEHYPYAEPNQEDGTLICYNCRNRW